MSVISVIEADAEKVLTFLTGAEEKVTTVGPKVVAGLGTILGAVGAAIETGTQAAEADGLNIALDVTTFNNLKAVWSDIVAYASALGIKL